MKKKRKIKCVKCIQTMLIMLTKSYELKGMNKNTYVDEGYQLAEEIKKT